MNTRKSTSSKSWFETDIKMWRVPTWIYFTFSHLRILSVTDDQRCIQTRVVRTKFDIYVCILNVVKFLSFDMVYHWILYKSNTADATSGTRIFMLSVKHMLLNILIQWKFATLAKLNLKLCLFLLQEEYRLCYEALNIYIESTNVYANF
jgi:hypothetical protein